MNKIIPYIMAIIISFITFIGFILLYAFTALHIWEKLLFPRTDLWQNIVPQIGLFSGLTIALITFIFCIRSKNPLQKISRFRYFWSLVIISIMLMVSSLLIARPPF